MNFKKFYLFQIFFYLLFIKILFFSNISYSSEKYEDENWKCVVQNINENLFDGFGKCLLKNSDPEFSYYSHFNNGVTENLMFEIPTDDSYISFFEVDGAVSWKKNGFNITFYNDNSYFYTEYLDNKKNGCELKIGTDDTTTFSIFKISLFDSNQIFEEKNITKITKHTVEAKVVAFVPNEYGAFVENSFYYESNVVLDRNNKMNQIKSETHFAKLGENGYFGHGFFKVDNDTAVLDHDNLDIDGYPTAVNDIDNDILEFNNKLIEMNRLKILCESEYLDFAETISSKYSINFLSNDKYGDILKKIKKYIRKNFN